MPPISDEIKEFIVKGLASFDTPSEVVEAVKANFAVEVSRQQVYAYDPRCTQPPAPRWQELHAATRAAYLSELAEIGIAQKVFRLRALDRMARFAMQNRSPGRAQALLEQAAKECGGVFEQNRGQKSGPSAAEIDAHHPTPTRRGLRRVSPIAQIAEVR
jgi:hypothetical protein